MKVIVLTLTTLCLTAVTQAGWDYKLQCTREEVGIRWPSYYSHSEYYMCQREGGIQLTYTCPHGELFAFALQTCAPPSKFIPPPPLNILPISSSLTGAGAASGVAPPSSSVNQPSQPNKPLFPKPIETEHKPDHMRPPVMVPQFPAPVPEESAAIPPVIVNPPQAPENPIEEEPTVEKEDVEIESPPSKPGKPFLPGKPKPQIPSLPSKPSGNPEAPLPPTPPPTPPVVPEDESPKKKPPSLPSAGKKQPPKSPADAKKQPPKPAGKKQPASASAKKQPLKPTGKKQSPKQAEKKLQPKPSGKKLPPVPQKIN